MRSSFLNLSCTEAPLTAEAFRLSIDLAILPRLIEMPRTPEEQDLIERFAKTYRLGQTVVMREIERAVCGCDYGGESYTTRGEAEDMAEKLALRPGRRLLEVGAGSGWPGLYLADLSGCDVALVDIPFEGLQIAAARAVSDQIAGRCWLAVADGAALSFESESFDAVAHSDVLCCLDVKLPVLKECRRVVRPAGKMVFSVISIATGLSSIDHQRAKELGPPYVETEDSYPAMLEQAGWRITDCVDMTAAYQETAEMLLLEDEAHAAALSDVLGEADCEQRLRDDRNIVRANHDGLFRRELFDVEPVSKKAS